jgi:hypothetical protein
MQESIPEMTYVLKTDILGVADRPGKRSFLTTTD